MASDEQPIIVKKVIKKGGGGHGAAWKVAYADFVTAMMAFFLLLWILNATTDEQKQGIADYFAPTLMQTRSTSSGRGVMSGRSLDNVARLEGSGSASVVTLPIPKPGVMAEESEDEVPAEAKPNDIENPVDFEHDLPTDGDGMPPEGDAPPAQFEDLQELAERSAEELVEELARREEESFIEAEYELRQAIENLPELAGMEDHLLIDRTPEGLRIQLVDQQKESMFSLGSARMTAETERLMQAVARVVNELPNEVAISGHTDALQFSTDNGYSNWELSTDRANASRRALLRNGVAPDRIAKVVGLADRDPLLPEDPTNPNNRRISIVLLRDAEQQAEELAEEMRAAGERTDGAE